MQFFNLMKIIFQHGWPIVCLLIIAYADVVLPVWFEPRIVWILRAWLPGDIAILAFILYRQHYQGALTALVFSAVIALGVGCLITWTVGEQLLRPYLPCQPEHILWAMQNIDWLNLGHSMSSTVVGLVLMINIILDYKSKLYQSNQARTTHGSARLALKKAIKTITTKAGLPLGLLPSGYYPYDPLKTATAIQNNNNGTLLFTKPAHTMVIAPSGAGKGVGYVIPTLLEYPGPVFVTDIKGENYAVTARYRRSLGRRVVTMDPFNITNTATITINLFDLIADKPETAVDDTLRLAKLLCPTNTYESDNTQYFTDHGAQLLQCLLLHVKFESNYKSHQKHLGTVYDILSLGDSHLKNFLERLTLEQKLGCGNVARLAAIYKDTPEREFSGITNTARRQLQFLISPAVRSMLTSTNFDIRRIVDENTDFYLCIPFEELESQARLIRLITSLTVVLMTQARGRRGQQNLLMIVDEMPALGYVPQFEKILTIGRGFGLTFMGISQSLDILRSVYPKTWRTFLSANTTIFIDASEVQTAEYIAQKLGKSTIQQQSHNEGSSQQKSGPRQLSQQAGTSVSDTGRSLLTADEVASLGSKVSIVFLRGERALLLRRLTYYQQQRWKKKFDANPLEK